MRRTFTYSFDVVHVVVLNHYFLIVYKRCQFSHHVNADVVLRQIFINEQVLW